MKTQTATKTANTTNEVLNVAQDVFCPYCGVRAELVHSSEIYRTGDYGMVYLCRPCDAYVGVHAGTENPMGTLANAELRKWRKAAHAAFDPSWMTMSREARRNPAYTRKGRYARLAELMGIPVDECHIGMFNEIQCDEVIELCAMGMLD